MKHLHKECKNMKEVNQYLRSIKLEDFELDAETFTSEFDYDGWMDETERNGVSVNVTIKFEVFIVKYTANEIEKLEKELDL